MADSKEYMIHQEEAGTIQISEDVLASIASNAALETEGVSALMSANVSDLMGGKKMTSKGVKVELDGENIVVNLFIAMRYGSAIGEAAKKVLKRHKREERKGLYDYDTQHRPRDRHASRL